MLQLFLCCPRMNLLSFTLTTWKVERHSVLRTKPMNGYNQFLKLSSLEIRRVSEEPVKILGQCGGVPIKGLPKLVKMIHPTKLACHR